MPLPSPHTSHTLALTLIGGAGPHRALSLWGLWLGPGQGEDSAWTQGQSDVYFPGVPRGDEWKLALGVDTRGEDEEEDMWVLLK